MIQIRNSTQSGVQLAGYPIYPRSEDLLRKRRREAPLPFRNLIMVQASSCACYDNKYSASGRLRYMGPIPVLSVRRQNQLSDGARYGGIEINIHYGSHYVV